MTTFKPYEMRKASDMSLTLLSTLLECQGRSLTFGLKLLAVKVGISSFETSCISGGSAPYSEAGNLLTAARSTDAI